MALSSSEQCSFCENTSESLLHLFWKCPKTKVFWNEVIKWFGNFSFLLTKSFSPQLCLGFVDDTTALLLHHALLIARYHIFWAKSMHHLPSPELFTRNFLICLEVERRFLLKNGFLAKFNKNGELSSPNKKTSFRFVPNIFVLLICVTLRTLM